MAVENVIRQNGATPATIGLIRGQIRVGLSSDEIQWLAKASLTSDNDTVIKVSRRDIAFAMARGLSGGTTVSGTMLIAHQAGIALFATGGIGGVHRGVEQTMDISADLVELGRTPVNVVCAGVKSILDIGRTLEFLETQGVPVVTFDEQDAASGQELGGIDFPAFFTRSSGFKSPLAMNRLDQLARMIRLQWEMQLSNGVLIAVPIPATDAADGVLVEQCITQAVAEAQ